MYKKETKETLDSIKDYSNYNLNKFDISISNSRIKSRKMSISSMDEQISKLDSDISELYKIYRETKKARIRKEKSEKNLINRINYLTSEEKKLRTQMMSKNNLRRHYYQTTYNTYKNSPKIRNKRINSVDNYTTINTKGNSFNLNDTKKYKTIVNTKNDDSKKLSKNKLYNSLVLDSKSIDNKKYNMRDIMCGSKNKNNKQNITNNICIIINKNGFKNDDKNNEKNRNLNKFFNTKKSKRKNTKYRSVDSKMKNNSALSNEGSLSNSTFKQKDFNKKLSNLKKSLNQKKNILNKIEIETGKDQSKKYLFNISNISNISNDNQSIIHSIQNSKRKEKAVPKKSNNEIYNRFFKLDKTKKNNIIKRKNKKGDENSSLNSISVKSSIEQKKEVRPLFINKESMNNKKTKESSIDENSSIIKSNEDNHKENNKENLESVENDKENNKKKDKEMSQYNETKDKIKMMNNYINNHKDIEAKKINKKKKKELIDNFTNNNDNSCSYDEKEKDIPKIKNYKNEGYYFNYKINNNLIMEQRIQKPSIHENELNKNRNRNNSIDNQINANHNMIKRLFRQNKKNNSCKSIDTSFNNKEKNNIVNDQIIKNEILAIRRINLHIENFKNNNFYERNKNHI